MVTTVQRRRSRLAFPAHSLPCCAVLRASLPTLAWLTVTAVSALAEPLSKKTEIDFFRDVPSRNLKGLATRSDGRLVAGPVLTESTSAAPAPLLWCLEPTPDPAKWWIGTGPEGRIFEVTLGQDQANFTASEIAKVEDPQVFALKRLPDGAILAGTSPKGALQLIRNGQPVARALLPVDSIFDLLLLDDQTALAATGNPGRLYKIDLKVFGGIGLIVDKITDAKILADRGITLVGEIRDRNLRRIVRMPDGGIAAGSSPKGNVYIFPKESYTGTPPADPAARVGPIILQENRDGEVTDLLPQPNGDLYATIVFASSSGEARLTPPASASKSGRDAVDTPPPAQAERFAGRSSLIWFPARGFPETLTARANTAFYRIVRQGDLLLLAGGEQGEIAGYDLNARLSLTFPGSISAQLNGLAPLATPGRYLVLRSNAPGLAVLDFQATGTREAETRRLDLTTPAQLGALRFNRLRQIAPGDLALELRTSNGSDEVEGWGPWTALRADPDQGWRSDALRGRYAKLRIRINPPAAATVPAAANTSLELDRATLFALPQNRRPTLSDFRVLTPGFGIIAAADQPPSAVVLLSQVMQPPRDDDRRKGNFLTSQVVPSPGAQVVLWTVTDPDGDALTYTFSIRRDGDPAWIDVGAGLKESYVQFDTAHLPDGVYFTRLVAREAAPRPAAEQLSQHFETDDLIIDHTAPEVIEASASRNGDVVAVTVHGRDQLSLLEGIEVLFNNGVRETLEQPADGVRDGREETFKLQVPIAKISNATSLEVTLYDTAGNGTARRLTW